MNEIYEQRLQDSIDHNVRFEDDIIVSVIVAIGNCLEKVLQDPEHVEKTMNTLLESYVGADYEKKCEGDDWRERWQSFPLAATTTTAQLMEALKGFAYYGLDFDYFIFGATPVNGDGKIDQIARVVEMARHVLDAIPAGWGDCQLIEATVLAAEARVSLDLNTDLTIPQLAALSRLSINSINNLSAPGNAVPPWTLTPDGKIPSRLAKDWLEKRADFHASIWRLRQINIGERISEDEYNRETQVVFVPHATDGTMFDPDVCRGKKGYPIGPKGEEEQIDDYLTALDRLVRMRIPRWRRPNASGNWGIVTGVSWRRYPLEELGLLSEEA